MKVSDNPSTSAEAPVSYPFFPTSHSIPILCTGRRRARDLYRGEASDKESSRKTGSIFVPLLALAALPRKK